MQAWARHQSSYNISDLSTYLCSITENKKGKNMNRKQTILDFLSDDRYPPVNVEELMLMLDIPFDDREELMLILEELTEESLIIKTSRKKYASPEKLGFVTGKVSLARGGFGFLLRDEGDIFIPPSALGGALGGDTVMLTLTKKGSDTERPEGKVTKIIKRASDKIVGTFQNSRSFGFVIPDDDKIPYDIFISKKKFANARHGQKVVVKITKWHDPSKRIHKPEGEICEVLGFAHEPGVDLLSVMRAHGLKKEFGDRVNAECNMIDNTISEADVESRCDFRDDMIITIDGSDSRDFDDAVGISFEDGVYTLGVHIADVTHYVQEGSALDREAFRRGTSVYFPGSVVPMLPPILSNGICSLNPNEDRLTLSVIMKINTNGEVVEHSICEGIICSKERMTYDDVTAILEGDEALRQKYSHILEDLSLMEELSVLLRNRRMQQGSIDFDFPETKIVTDENGKAIDVYKYVSAVSNKIIEEFMLLANKTVAEEFFWTEIPFVYRVHEKPSTEKIRAFNDFGKNMGYRLPVSREPHPGEFAKILNEIKGTREELVVSKVMLRSLMKAKYSDKCMGHFGLAFKYYCHFTSPIRRYPDLAIHRIIKEFITCGISEKRMRYYSKFVTDAAARSSETELAAMEAEREADDIKKAEYMLSHIGEDFDAIISSVTSFGFYAELENGIEGLVRLSDLKDDYYILSDVELCLIGEHTGKRYSIGDSVRVTVAGADVHSGNIDFIKKDDTNHDRKH